MVRSVKPSSFAEPARAELARSRTATANRELRRMFIRSSLTKPAHASSVLLHAQVWDSGPVVELARGGGVARIMRIQLVAGTHALLLHEHRPAQSKALLDVLAGLRDANVDHAFLGARNRSVATAQSTAPRQRNRTSET